MAINNGKRKPLCPIHFFQRDWHTNFKADQEGQVIFHYSIFPHDAFDAATATMHGLESNQPLINDPADIKSTALQSLFSIGNKNIILSSLKPSVDKKGMILRLYNASHESQIPGIKWERLKPKNIYWSNANEEKMEVFKGDERWDGFGFKSLFVEF